MTWPIGELQSRRATGAHDKAPLFVLNRASMAVTPLVSGILPDGECGGWFGPNLRRRLVTSVRPVATGELGVIAH